MTSLTFADLGSAGRQKQSSMMSFWPTGPNKAHSGRADV